MELSPVTNSIGAEVTGVDLTQPLSAGLVLDLDRALAEHGVLFFRDQHVTPRQQLDFGACLGELHVHPYEHNLGGQLEAVLVLDSERYRSKGKTPVPWHTDATFEQRPPRGSVLRAVELPPVGGDTLWANMYAAYESLSSRMQRFLDDLDAVHDAGATFGGRLREGRVRDDAVTEMRSTVHPVVTAHPVSGRKVLFVNRQFTSHIVDLSSSESDRILEHLFHTVHAPDIQVRLRWRPGTVAVWDNRCTQHYAVGGYEGRRVMNRVTFLGPPPKR